MTIKITQPKIVPELKYENVFILEFKIIQTKGQDQNFDVEYEYILYAEKQDGSKIFDEKSLTKEKIKDFENTIKKEISQEQAIELLNSMVGIEQAISTLINIRQGVESTVVSE